jgi:hypothetical protein
MPVATGASAEESEPFSLGIDPTTAANFSKNSSVTRRPFTSTTIEWGSTGRPSKVVHCPLRISDSIRCDTQMLSNAKAIYWTMVSSILWDQLARRAAFTLPLTSTPRPARKPLRSALREACQQMRVTRDVRKIDFSSTSGWATFGYRRMSSGLRLAANRHQGMMDVRS